jgi:hypothetical protein
MKSSRMIGAGHAALTEEKGSTYWWGKLKEKASLLHPDVDGQTIMK